MNPLLAKLGLLVWRLIPANPILVRVVQGASRRTRHLWIRFAYLAALVMVVLLLIVSTGDAGGATLNDLAKNASRMFMYASIAQLGMMCFLAPVFTAGAITQERDAQTFNILLATPLSNAQIVLGSLMSRLYFVLMLLLAGLPIFLMMMIYGGVTFPQIIQSFAIAGATAILTGSLAICISMIRVGTRRTILSFYIMIGLYLVAVFLMAGWPATWIPESPGYVTGHGLSWLTAFHPFLALDVALNRVAAPDPAALAGRGFIAKYFLAYPQRAYVLLTMLVSVALTVVAVFFVRQPKEGEVGALAAVFAFLTRRELGERRRKPRPVWHNPVAWREARTRASAATRGLVNVLLLGGGLAAAVLLLIEHVKRPNVAFTRIWLSYLLQIETFLVLLAATNTAATAMTKEKESKSLELLLVTPVTSRYIVWGKLRGLVTFALPLIAVPTITVLMFGLHGLVNPKQAVLPIEIAALLPLALIAYTAVACVFALYVSLHTKRTVKAVMFSLAVVTAVTFILTLIFGSFVYGGKLAGAAMAPLSPFVGVRVWANASLLFDTPKNLGPLADRVRAWSACGTGITLIVYAVFVAGFYNTMVRNFDMVLRKQSAQL